jgi:hypothetical protein
MVVDLHVAFIAEFRLAEYSWTVDGDGAGSDAGRQSIGGRPSLMWRPAKASSSDDLRLLRRCKPVAGTGESQPDGVLFDGFDFWG